MNAQNKFLTFFLMLSLITTSWGQVDEKTFSIKDCIFYAQDHNPNIQVAHLSEKIAHQQLRQYHGSGLPQVNLTGNFEDRLKIPLLIIPGLDQFAGGAAGKGIPQGYQYNSSLSGEVSQMLYNQSFWVALKTAKSNTEYYEENTRQVKEETAYNIANAYYQVIVAQKQLDLLHTNLASMDSTLKNTQLQYENGVAKKVDVSRLQVNVNNLESQIKQSELAFTTSMNALKFQMGMSLTEDLTLTDTAFTFNTEDIDVVNDARQFYENRVDYQLLKTQQDMQVLDRKNNAAGYFPKLTAFGNYGYSGSGSEFGLYGTNSNGWTDYTSSAIGLRLSWNLFDGFQRDAQVQQSRIKSQQLEQQMRLTKSNIDMQVSNAQAQYLSTVQRIKSEQRNVALAGDVHRITVLEFQQGVSTSTDVVEAETSLRQAQNTYITTLLDLYTARLKLEQAKGTILSYLNIK